MQRFRNPDPGEEASAPSERTRLVRLCARITGDTEVAEDLAQETLLEAWRHEHGLRDVNRRSEWLSGIARNVCLRWARKRARESARVINLLSADGSASLDPDDWATDGFDLEIELERHELAHLLDRAMGMLPPDVRAVLVERYVEESPHSETAARLGLTEAAVAKRLERGRLLPRRVLTTDLSREAASFGPVSPCSDGWQETRIWCPECGRRRLLGRFSQGHTELTLRCPSCCTQPDANIAHLISKDLFHGVKGFKPALSRVMASGSRYFREVLASGGAHCSGCGRPLPLLPGPNRSLPDPMEDATAFHIACPDCGYCADMTLHRLALALPEAQRFWREHPKIRALPEHHVEAAGGAALVHSYESMTGRARLDVVSRRDGFEVMEIHGAPEE